MRTFFSVCLLSFLSLTSASAQSTPTSNGPYGGYVQHLASDSSGRVYAATFLGGIFRTTDEGNSWEDLYNDTAIVDVRTLAMGSGGTIYAGLDPGFMRSTDAGATWQKMGGLLNTRSVVSILILPNGNLLAGTITNGVYRSTNGGTSFAESNDSLTNSYTWSLAATASGDTVFVATNGGGMFRSVNGGTTWSPSNNGLTEVFVTWVGFAPDGSLFACAANAIFRSTDYGDSWSNLSVPSASYRAIAFAPGAYYAATTGGPLAGDGVYASTDGGASWNPEPGLPGQNYLTILYSGGTIFAGSAGRGVYRRPSFSGTQDRWSQDGRTEGAWTHAVTGMAATLVTSLAFDTTGVLFAGTRFAGIFRSTDSAATWVDVSDSIPHGEWINDIAVSPVTKTVFAAGTYGSYRSSDGGDSWETSTMGQATLAAVNGFGTVFSSLGGNIRRSTNDGMTWSGQLLPGVSMIVDAAFDDSTAYLATGVGKNFGTSRGVWRSTNDGQTWAAFNDSLSNLNVVAVAVGDTASGLKRLAAPDVQARKVGSGGYGNCDQIVIVATYNGGVYSLDDVTWVHSAVNSGSTYQWSGFYVPSGDSRYHMVANRGELAERDDILCDWNMKTQVRLPNEVNSVVVLRGPAGGDDALYGSLGAGVINLKFRVTATETEPSLPARFALHQNYPNPFNPSTTIRFDVPATGWVSLKVFDILGRETAVLMDGIESPGRKEIVWEANNAAAGVYFLRFHAGERTETRTMVLMK